MFDNRFLQKNLTSYKILVSKKIYLIDLENTNKYPKKKLNKRLKKNGKILFIMNMDIDIISHFKKNLKKLF